MSIITKVAMILAASVALTACEEAKSNNKGPHKLAPAFTQGKQLHHIDIAYAQRGMAIYRGQDYLLVVNLGKEARTP